MDIMSQKQYWFNSDHHDLEVAESLFNNKKYDWCLFVGHLVYEFTKLNFDRIKDFFSWICQQMNA